jgi:DHA2 family multidrug resistance protein
MSGFNLNIDFNTAMWARTLQAFGLAFLFVPINVAAFSSIPRERLGYATGLMNLFRNVGGSAGIAMVTTMMARRSQFHQGTLVGHVTPLDPGYGDMLAGTTSTLGQGASAADAAGQAQAVYGAAAGVDERHDTFFAVADFRRWCCSRS